VKLELHISVHVRSASEASVTIPLLLDFTSFLSPSEVARGIAQVVKSSAQGFLEELADGMPDPTPSPAEGK
jgi:hypothetical protein